MLRIKPAAAALTLRTLTALVGALMALVTSGVAMAQAPVAAPPPLSICNGSPVPIEPGSTPTTPGVWWNPARTGSGWQMMYLADNETLTVGWFTFDQNGLPTWLLSEIATVDRTANTWQSVLYKYTWNYAANGNGGARNPPVQVGTVAIRFDPSDALRLAIQWQWDAVGSGLHTECLRDFSLTLDQGRGVNVTYTGAWFEPGMPGYGSALNVVFQTATRPTRYLETMSLTVFDDQGNPVWLMGAGADSADPPPLGVWGEYPLYYRRTGPGYGHGAPTTDCLFSAGNCVITSGPVGRWRRNYSNPVDAMAEFEVFGKAMQLPHPAGTQAPVAVTKFDRPLGTGADQDGDGDPDSTGMVNLMKITSANNVAVDRPYCIVPTGQTACDIVVNWGANPHEYPYSALYVRDPVTQDITMISSSYSGEHTYSLPLNKWVNFELRSGPLPGHPLLYRSIQVHATGNAPPTATLDSPASGVQFTSPATIQLAATASDSDGEVVKVEFLVDGAVQGTPITTPPYQMIWANVAAGSYSVSARATDDLGGVFITTPRTVVVNAPAPAPLPDWDLTSDSVGATAGEFRVDESGAATYSIPLYAAPGTAGVVPQLSLNYSSQAGMGVMGRGWSIGGTSSISRCRSSLEAGDVDNSTKTPQPVGFNSPPINFSDTDRLCLDGQRLLEVTDSPACKSMSGYTRRQFRTEIESYRRVCAYTPTTVLGNGPKFFTVEAKDGSTSWYGDRRFEGGLATNAFQAATTAGHTNSYYLWAIGRFEDSTGNYIDFEYLKNPGGISRPGELLLHRASYTGKRQLLGQSTSASPPYAHIEFEYEPFQTNSELKGFMSGSEVWTTRRLKRVYSRASNAMQNDVTLRYYDLQYQTAVSGAGETHLKSVQECRDVELPNASMQTVCLNPTTFTWSPAQHGFQESTPFDFDLELGSALKFHGMKLGDVDGDGRLDMVWIKDGENGESCETEQVHVFYGRHNNGSHRFVPGSGPAGFLCTPVEFVADDEGNVDRNWFLLDYNGDGRDDLFLSGSSLWQVQFSMEAQSGTRTPFNMDLQSNPISALGLESVAQGQSVDRPLQRADLNGDGLPDLIYHTNAGLVARLMARPSGGGAYAWGLPMTVQVEGVSSLSGPNPPGVLKGLFGRNGFEQLYDFNGDGRSDVVIVVDVTGSNCGGGGPPGGSPEPPPITPREQQRPGGSTPPGPTGSTCTVPWVHAMVVEQITTSPTGGTIRIRQMPGGQLGNGYFEGLRFVDLNGDGLTDIFNTGFSYTFPYIQINDGVGFGTARHAFPGDSPFLPNARLAQVLDVNGDGRMDVVYPSQNATSYSTENGWAFAVRLGIPVADALNGGGVGFSPELTNLPGWSYAASACATTPCTPDNRSYFFDDFDRDGGIDFMRVHWRSSNADASLTSGRSPRVARDVITRITNGLGAKTEFEYRPMNNRSVYRRDRNSRDLQYGRQSPIQDVHSTTYVVSEARSSAPTQGNANAMSKIFYRYVGAKVQAGGRGYLGFREIHTIDANHGTQGYVVTKTEYLQEFPFIGRPDTTMRLRVEGQFQLENCYSSPADNCFVTGAEAPFTYAGANIISESHSNWGPLTFSLGTPGQPLRVELQSTVERTYDLESSQLLSRVETSYTYPDAWGNVGSTSVKTFADDVGTTPLSTVTTGNQFTVEDPLRWRLGRLSTSTVTHARVGTAPVTRKTDFTYAMSGAATGLLTSQSIQKNTAQQVREHLQTHHVHDDYGNQLRTHTCSNDLLEADCKAMVGQGAFAFQVDDINGTRIQRYERREFEGNGRFLKRTYAPFWNGSGAAESITSEVLARNEFGDVTRASDVNGVQAMAKFSSLGRPYYAWAQTVAGGQPGNPAHGVVTLTTYRRCTEVPCPAGAAYRERTQTSGQPTKWVYADVLGRPMLTAVQTMNHPNTGLGVSATCSTYDALGRSASNSSPFFLLHSIPDGEPTPGPTACAEGGGRHFGSTTYDLLGRPLVAAVPAEAPNIDVTLFEYNGLETEITNARSHTRKEVRNALGELTTVFDATGFPIINGYDAAGNLTTVTRNAGRGDIVSTMVYDSLGRKTQSQDPDAGAWQYKYNALGEVVEQIALHPLQAQRIEQRYDARGRVHTRRVYNAGGQLESSEAYVYDTAPRGRGQLAQETVTGDYLPSDTSGGQVINFQREHLYDLLGRPRETVVRIDNVNHVARTHYDALGRAYKTQDASGRWLKTQFGASGHVVAQCESDELDQLPICIAGPGTYLSVLQTDAWGNVTHERRGDRDDLRVTRSYHPENGRLQSICSGTAGCSLQSEIYTWDEVGNLKSRDKAGQYAESFIYDELNRLTSGTYTRLLSTPASQTSLSLQYDKLGNICSKLIGANPLYYFYDGQAGCGMDGTPGWGENDPNKSPHAVRNVGGAYYEYDDYGNNVRRLAGAGTGARFTRYSAQQQAVELGLGTEGMWTERSRFWYAGGARYKREDNGGGITGTRKTLYLGNVEIITNNATTTIKRYIAGVAVQDIVNGVATTRYLFGDHLGSIVRWADANGIAEPYAGSDFGAFGERRGYVDPRVTAAVPAVTNRGFTGHEMLDALNVVHMNGRVYDNRIGRFMQVDPYVQEPKNAQNYNRYTYLWNNPLNATDPSGFLGVRERQWAAAIITIAAVATQQYYALKGSLTAGSASFIGYYTAVGAVSGGVATGSWNGALKGAISGFVSASVGGAIGQLSYGEQILVQGTTQGTLSYLQGGKFGHAFAAAGLGVLTPGAVSGITSSPVGQFVATVIAGGTISAVTGGKFANGAVTAALSFAVRSQLGGMSDGDEEPEPHTIHNLIVARNSAWGRKLKMTETDDMTVMELNLTVSADPALPDGYVDSTILEIETAWNVSRHRLLGRSYTLKVSLSRIDGPGGDLELNYWADADAGKYARGGIGRGVMYLSMVDKPLTRAHEFGHNLGFRHQNNYTNSIMSYSSSRRVTYTDLMRLSQGYGGR